MIINYKYLTATLLIIYSLILSVLLSLPVSAHIMVAQNGTLNIVDDGVFMVLSLPVSAFEGIDDDEDGKLSQAEFNTYRPNIINTIQKNVILSDTDGKLALQGMILSPVTSHSSPQAPSTQIIIMGRFSLTSINSALNYQINLFGKFASEQILKITVTDKNKHKIQTVNLTPINKNVALFME